MDPKQKKERYKKYEYCCSKLNVENDPLQGTQTYKKLRKQIEKIIKGKIEINLLHHHVIPNAIIVFYNSFQQIQ